MLFIVEQLRSASDQFDFRANDLRLFWVDASLVGGDGYTFHRNEATVYNSDVDVLSEQDMIELKGGWAIVIPVGDLQCGMGISS